jgi:hypothetical protein
MTGIHRTGKRTLRAALPGSSRHNVHALFLVRNMFLKRPLVLAPFDPKGASTKATRGIKTGPIPGLEKAILP